MKILAIIVSYNFERWLERCLSSLINSEHPIDILVIDNASKDHTTQRIKTDYPQVRLIESSTNLGFGRANNLGMQLAIKENYDAVFLINQDAWINSDTIGTLATLCQKYTDYGIVSPTHLTGSGDKLDPGFETYLQSAKTAKEKDILDAPFINAAFWMIPVSTLQIVGGFCPLFYHYGEDKDYINRIHYHGYKVGYSSQVSGCHDREYRPVSHQQFLRTEYVYHLSEYVNINHSFCVAFGYGIFALVKKCLIALCQGKGKLSGEFLTMSFRLLMKSRSVYNYRRQNKLSQPNYIQPV